MVLIFNIYYSKKSTRVFVRSISISLFLILNRTTSHPQKVDEIVVYSEQKDGKTLAVRRAYISSQVFGFSRAIRAFGIERFKSNGNKASNGFNHVLRRMFPHSQLVIHPQPSIATASSASELAVATVATTSSSSGNHNKSETFKSAAKVGYEFFKCHASKIAQLFSVRN